MAVVASLVPRTVVVGPDEAGGCEIHVRNTGSSAGDFTVHVTGEAAAWVSVFPRSITVGPGSEGIARLVVSVPPSSSLGGRSVPFEVRVVSEGDAGDGDLSAVAQGTVELAPSHAVSVDLTPRSSRSRGSAQHVLRLENRGTSPVTATLRATEADHLLHLAVQPPTLSADPGGAASAKVTVRPRRRILRPGHSRACPFEVVAEPQGAEPVSAEGVFHQQPVLARGVPAMLAGVLVLALAVGLAAFGLAGQNDSDRTPGEATPAAAPAMTTIPTEQHGGHAGPGCPMDGHTDPDPVNHSTEPAAVRRLPRDYSFMYPGPDRCRPARFNPCEPIHYVLNPALAPPGGVADARAAIAQVSRATGITFIEDAMTNETIVGGNRNPYQPERYGPRWAPVLIVWERTGSGQSGEQAAGRGGPYVDRRGGVITSGVVGLNVDAVTDRRTGAHPADGFRAGRLGVGPIGPEGVTWGRVLLHELAHVMGLGHSSDRAQLMYPEATEQTTTVAEYGRGDLAGLRLLGREAGCLQAPPPLRPGP